MYAITNASIVGEDEILTGMDLIVHDDTIADIVPTGRLSPGHDRRPAVDTNPPSA